MPGKKKRKTPKEIGQVAPAEKRPGNPTAAEKQPGNTAGWAVEYDEVPKKKKWIWEVVREGAKRR